MLLTMPGISKAKAASRKNGWSGGRPKGKMVDTPKKILPPENPQKVVFLGSSQGFNMRWTLRVFDQEPERQLHCEACNQWWWYEDFRTHARECYAAHNYVVLG